MVAPPGPGSELLSSRGKAGGLSHHTCSSVTVIQREVWRKHSYRNLLPRTNLLPQTYPHNVGNPGRRISPYQVHMRWLRVRDKCEVINSYQRMTEKKSAISRVVMEQAQTLSG